MEYYWEVPGCETIVISKIKITIKHQSINSINYIFGQSNPLINVVYFIFREKQPN